MSDPQYRVATPDEHREFRLHCELGRLDLVQWLLSGPIDYRDSYPTALEYAALGGQLPVMQHLVSLGVLLDEEEEAGPQALWTACAHGQLEAVRYLLGEGVDLHSGEEQGLCDAADGGHRAVVEYLLQRGADPAAQNSLALGYAVDSNHPEVVDLLIRRGAPLGSGWKAACRAAHLHHLRRLREAGIRHEDHPRSLLLAVQSKSTEAVQYVASQGTFPAADRDEAFLLACVMGDLAMVQCLEELAVTGDPDPVQSALDRHSEGLRRICDQRLPSGPVEYLLELGVAEQTLEYCWALETCHQPLLRAHLARRRTKSARSAC